MARKLTWLGGILLAVGLLFFVAWSMLRSDTISKPSAAFLAMTQALSSAREVASKCWNDRRLAVLACDAVKEQLPKQQSVDVLYFVSDQGALIGIDYANRVVVVLTPHVETGELKWHCAGSPADAVSKLCRSV